jgi:exoribonuclease-2
MLPEAWIDAFSLAQGRRVPALSLYLDLDPLTLETRAARSVLETVQVAHNLRYDLIEETLDEESIAAGTAPVPCAAALAVLWRLAVRLRGDRERVRGRPEPRYREEVSLQPEGEGGEARVRRVVRRRGSPLDLVVAELMIHANCHWGAQLDQAGRAAIYRSQSLGRVRMATVPAPHEGLGVAQYAWCTSPLRRYVDLVNQRQLVGMVTGQAAAHRRGDAELFAAVSAFEAAYTSYAEFQESMERYWSLRWLQQEGLHRVGAQALRGDVVRVDGLPLTLRVAGADALARGQRLDAELGAVDLVDLSVEARLAQVYAAAEGAPAQAAGDETHEAGAAAAD